MPSITIVLGTYKRPKMLAQTLSSLCSLEIPDRCTVHLILIDNAPEEPAETIYNQYKDSLPFASTYLQEPKKGLVLMRNRELQEAMALQTDFLAMLDDDVIVRPDWLAQLYQTHLKFQADVVSGRTLRMLPESTPQWIIKGNFFQKGNRPTGTPRLTSSTNNVFFNFKKLCIEWNLRFDERLNYTAGEDILFFRQAHEKGARIIWCNESILTEVIPESRITQKSLLERAYAIGTVTAYRYRRLFPPYHAYPRMLFFSIGECIVAFTYFFRPDNGMPIINQTRRLHHLQLAKGVLNGLFKMKGAEVYKQQHGF